MQIYDVAAFSIAGVQSSWLVPPLLAAFYVVLGGLQIAADALKTQSGDAATIRAVQRADWPFVALNAGCSAHSQLSRRNILAPRS